LPDGEKKTNLKKKIAKYERFIFLFLKWFVIIIFFNQTRWQCILSFEFWIKT
jgi:hypothetical protein